MQASTLWWIAAGLAVAVELATGTFYLLMIALGMAGGAVAAHLGSGLTTQITVAALVGGGAVAAWARQRRRRPAAAAATSNRDVNIDIGERVHVTQWNADGTARIHYRGSLWWARFRGPDAPAPGDHVIRAVEGSELLLERWPAGPLPPALN